jgi:hypothetical protein
MRIALIWLLSFTLLACSSSKSDLKLLDAALESYASTLRWGEPSQLVSFIDPKQQKRQPINNFDLNHLQQLRIASFRAEPPIMLAPDHARQIAQVDVVNIHTQKMRSHTDISEWRFDVKNKQWWLSSGLPKFQEK